MILELSHECNEGRTFENHPNPPPGGIFPLPKNDRFLPGGIFANGLFPAWSKLKLNVSTYD